MRSLVRRLVELLLPWYDRHEQERRYVRSVARRQKAEQAIRRAGGRLDGYRDVRL